MKKINVISSLFFTVTVALLLTSSIELSPSSEINIHYTLNYTDDSWEKNRVGLLWALSYLGAELPKGSFNKNIKWIDERTFCINFKNLGFNQRALAAVGTICDSLKATAVYKKTNSIDLGHFITLTLGSSWHYYEITGVPRTYTEFIKEHTFTSHEVFPLTHSTVSKHHRILKFNASENILHSAFVAEEGAGKIDSSTFVPSEFEVLDVMKNGQLRFMVYNAKGNLIAAGNKSLGEAGKPAKCIWCHEIYIQPLFKATDTLQNFITPNQFQEKIKEQNVLLKAYRKKLHSEIDFSKLQDHTYQELIYISFMEPSLERLSQEWKMPLEHLRTLLKEKPRHTHHEFTFLGELLHREALSDSANYNPGKLPKSIREENESEPDYFKFIDR
jgi:hypothetical protein